jgi:hypothetical protein
MNEPQLDEFEIWFKNQISGMLQEDEHFTQAVLQKVAVTQTAATQDTDNWTSVSWLFCVLGIAILLMQSLTHIEPEPLAGPVLQSLGLVGALLLASWQCQAGWVQIID